MRELVVWTYYIYVGIRPRLRLLIDTIWLSVVGVVLTGSWATATYKCSSLRISSGLGLVNIRDGMVLRGRSWKESPRRRLRRGMPLVFAALISRNLAENQ